jgi:hypothetical protein
MPEVIDVVEEYWRQIERAFDENIPLPLWYVE